MPLTSSLHPELLTIDGVTSDSDSDTLFRIEELHAEFRTKEGVVRPLAGVNLELKRGRITALTGESGSGKSTLALAALNLLPHPGRITHGRLVYHGRDLLAAGGEEWRRIRGRRISMIFQDPTSGLNPILPIGSQVAEMLTAHLDLKKKEARARAVQILRQIGLADPERVANAYPFQISGGMAQRVMIGIATALGPEIIIADEPTSALDVTVQAAILDDLDRLRREQDVSILLITHNFGIVAQLAQDVSVMYAGRVVEQGAVTDILARPRHPYTRMLLSALPRLDEIRTPLPTIRGAAPNLIDLPDQCPFLPRCPKATTRCRTDAAPLLETLDPAHAAACYNPVHEEWARLSL